MKEKQSPIWWLIILLAIVKFILPFVLKSPVYELQRDEFLYYMQGQHPALGYLENPPLLSYLATISSWMGGTAYGVSFWPSLIGAFTLILTCLLTAELGGKFFAQLLAGIAICTGAFLRTHALFQPNILDVFFWTSSIYFLMLFLRSQQTSHLIMLTISLALGFYGKYSIAFFAAALLIALLMSAQRKMLFQKSVYAAILVALVIILPNIYWQYIHNWPLVNHLEELRETQLKYVNKMDFIKDQFLMTLPVLFVWLGGLIWLFKNKELRFLGYTYLFVIALLITGSGKSYYALGIYPMLFAAGAVAWQQWTTKLKWLQSVLVLIILGFTRLILPMALPIYEPAKLAAVYKKYNIKHKWEDQQEHPLPQDFADMLGWKELSGKAESFFNGLPDSVKNNTIIYCGNYGQAGALQFYGKDELFKKKVISFNGSFLMWIPNNFPFKNLLLVTEQTPGSDQELFQHFQQTTLIDSVTDGYSRQLGNKIIFYQHADEKANQLANDALQQKKKLFSR
ncbi:glycosyltransferase family 39 protein [soil metagenome]